MLLSLDIVGTSLRLLESLKPGGRKPMPVHVCTNSVLICQDKKKNLFYCITGAGKTTALILSLFTLWLWLVHTVIPTLGDWGKKAMILRPTWCTQAIFYPQTNKQNYRKEISRSNRHKKGTRFWFSCIISKYFSRLLKYFSRFSRLWLRIKGFKVMVITLSEIRL